MNAGRERSVLYRTGILASLTTMIRMKTLTRYGTIALAGAWLTVASTTLAADAKSYQVTGPVLELTATKIVVQKGDEKWEIARHPDTKVTGDLKVGSKVTIYYTMAAQEVEVKQDKKK
jgi:hypothetical protein